MIKYDFMYLFYAEGQPVLQSTENQELEYSKNHQILQCPCSKLCGRRVDEIISKKNENHQELNGFKYESTKLFLGNPESSEEFFARQKNNNGLIDLDLKVTTEKMLGKSSERFGAKKPLVILKIYYVPKQTSKIV